MSNTIPLAKRFRPHGPARGVLAAVLGILGYLFAQTLLARLTGDVGAALVLSALLIAVLLVAARTLPITEAAAPITGSRRWLITVTAFVLTWLSAQALFIFLMIRVQVQVSNTNLFMATPIGLLAVIVVAPFIEELLCRALLYQHLGNLIGRGAALIISAAVFALLHLRPITVVTIFGLGVLTTVVFDLWGQNLIAAWLTHAGFNLAALTVPITIVMPLANPASLTVLLVCTVTMLVATYHASQTGHADLLAGSAWRRPVELSATGRSGVWVNAKPHPATHPDGSRHVTRISPPSTGRLIRSHARLRTSTPIAAPIPT